MKMIVLEDRKAAGAAAAEAAARLIRKTVATRAEANLIFATGASQFDFLAHLTSLDLPWDQVRMFHLDEYIGLPATHPASFRKYLRERLLDRTAIREYHLIDGEADPAKEVGRLNELIRRHPPDLACVGIGENGHLAFNDPPADFETEDPYIVVRLDERCKGQQVGEGWFSGIEEVPDRAISMSVRQIMKAGHIVCTVVGPQKADAMHACFDGPVTPERPASILREHPHCTVFLDRAAAAKLRKDPARY
ncbi:MAG: glucosamine-6-phosphate deaminase [Spirochaetales bacterium]|nr:glucosamine-6-phosphate deaminase [Spirochaetales bacterium]